MDCLCVCFGSKVLVFGMYEVVFGGYVGVKIVFGCILEGDDFEVFVGVDGDI